MTTKATFNQGLTYTYRVDEALEDYGRRLLEYTAVVFAMFYWIANSV